MSLSRRQLLHTSWHALMGLAVAPLGVQALLRVPDDRRHLQRNPHMVANKEASMATVAITQNTDIEKALKEALGHLPVQALVRGSSSPSNPTKRLPRQAQPVE